MQMSLKRKILLPTIILVALVMGVSTGITYYLSSNAFTDEATKYMSAVTKSRADLIDLWIETAKGEIQTAGRRAVYKAILQNDTDENRQPANAELAEQVKATGVFTRMHVINAQGEARASSAPDQVGKLKVGDRDYFQKAMAGQTFVSSVFLSRTTNQPTFSVAAPVRDGDKIIGVVFGVPDLTKFTEKFVSDVKVFETGYMALFDGSGMIFAHKSKDLIMKMNMNDYDFGRQLLRQKQGLIRYHFQGQARTAYVESCKNVDWLVLIVAPTKEFLGNVNVMTLINLILFIMGLLLISTALYFIVRSIVTPIHRISEGIDTGANQIASASHLVASTSQSLAEGASEQAAAVEETSSSLEEMSSMTKQNADNAVQARALMDNARTVVSKLDTQMSDMVSAIDAVTASSEETGKIIKTIDEIAFQTNLLALNAAVEAARAGEAGAGFAVVAGEVRNLAMRAAEAAKNTSSLIANTIATVSHSRDLTRQTQEAFKENVQISLKVGQLVAEISTASQEQANGIDQIGKAVAEMDKVIQQTAANAEESASAAEEMSAQSQQMKGYVGQLVGLVTGSGNSAERGTDLQLSSK